MHHLDPIGMPQGFNEGTGDPQKTSPASPASASCSEAHCGPWGLRGWCYNCGWMPFLAPKVSKAQATLEATENTTDLNGNDIEHNKNWNILKFSEDGTLFMCNLLKPIKNQTMVLINLPIKGRPDTKSKLAGRLYAFGFYHGLPLERHFIPAQAFCNVTEHWPTHLQIWRPRQPQLHSSFREGEWKKNTTHFLYG